MKMQSAMKYTPRPLPHHAHAVPVSPAELRRQVVEYRGKVSPIGAKLQQAVWAR